MDNNRRVFLNEKIAKKLFKNEKTGKILSAKVISSVIGASFEEVYNNIKLSSEEIAFSALTVNSTADTIYYDDVTYFDIELNFYNSISKVRQLESYVYQLYLGQIHTYKNYHMLKKIVQISIDTYDIFNKNEFMYKIVLMEEKYHLSYSDLIQFIHINIDYLRKLDYNNIVRSGNKLMKDLYFFTCDDNKKLDMVYKGDSLMEEIIKEAKEIAGIEKMNLYLTDEELMKQDQEFYFKKGKQEGIELGKQEGIELGKQENKIEMIINMFNDNVSLDTIAKYSNLSIDEVKKIIDGIK